MTDNFFVARAFKSLADIIFNCDKSVVFLGKRTVVVLIANFRHTCKHNVFFRVLFCVRHSVPDFLGCKAKHRRKEFYKRIENFIHCRLRASSRLAVRLFGVKSVFYNIKIEVTHINNAEMVNCVLERMEFITPVRLKRLFAERIEFVERPAVDFEHILIFNRIGIGIEIRGVAEDISRRISDFSVAF